MNGTDTGALGTLDASFQHARSRMTGFDDAHLADVLPFEQPEQPEHQIFYMQLKPLLKGARKCLTALTAKIAEYPGVDVDIVGIERTGDSVALTISIDAGPARDIPSCPPVAVAAFNLHSEIFSDLFDYFPKYSAMPSAEARALAGDVQGLLGEAGHALPVADVS